MKKLLPVLGISGLLIAAARQEGKLLGGRAEGKMSVRQAKQVLRSSGYARMAIDDGGHEVWWHEIYGPKLPANLSMHGKLLAMHARAVKQGEDYEAAAWEALAGAAQGGRAARGRRAYQVDSYDEVIRTVEGPLTFEYRGEENLYFQDRHRRTHFFKFDGREREEAKIASLFQDAFSDPGVAAEFAIAGANRGRRGNFGGPNVEVLRSTFHSPNIRSGTKVQLTFDTAIGQYFVGNRFDTYYRSRKGLKQGSPKARRALAHAIDVFEQSLLFNPGGSDWKKGRSSRRNARKV